jgi:2-amino-4-hydroxy-6-hydroxymethyldihydropteridine diphosphokinase
MTAVSRTTPVLVAAGSNVEPLAHLRRALDLLDAQFAPLRVSRAYANAAVGFTGDDFVNLVVGFDTSASVEAVLEQLHAVEAACGRPREAPKWAPRTMDLDVLLQGDLVCERPGLTLPRPDLLRRPYMLGPAAEIAPQTLHPTTHRTLLDHWNEMREHETHALRPVELGWTKRP